MSTTQLPVITILGTGLMGQPMARNLYKKGFTVHAWNRNVTKAQTLAAKGIQVFDTPAQAVSGADIVLTMLKDRASVEEVMQNAGPALRTSTIWLQMSTVGVEGIEVLEALAKQYGLIFYDAPVQGTRQPAEMAQLVILASGPVEQRSRVQPVFDAIGKRTVWLADQPGAGSRLKLALNAWVFALTHGLAESLALAKGLGIDPALVVDAITGSPMDNGYFQTKSTAILSSDYDASFTVANAAKDARLIAEAAIQAGIELDIARAGLQRFERALQAGHGDKDMAASYLLSR